MDLSQFAHVDVPLAMVLAILATVGYVFGTLQSRRGRGNNETLNRLKKDLSRATLAINELSRVIGAVRISADTHFVRLKKLQNRIAKLNSQQDSGIWYELCREVEEILDPTLALVGEINTAQERIRCQSNYLMTFSEGRTDPLTGLGNRRTLDQVLSTQFNMLKRYGIWFSVAILDIDRFKNLNDEHGHQHGDKMLCGLTELLRASLREADIASRHGGDEFVVVMPYTDAEGAAIMAERLRADVERSMPYTVSVGVASAQEADTPELLFKRADVALYRAKTGGRNRVCCDDGIPPSLEMPPAACPQVSPAPAL